MYNVRKIEENINICGVFRGEILYNEPLAPRTTFKVGGNAAVLIEPADICSLQTALYAVRKASVPYIVLGGGSNVVVPDEGLSYAVISLRKMDGIELVQENESTCRDSCAILRCGAGCTMDTVYTYCGEQRLGGLENFAGLPGTVGGAVYMNARCYDRSICDILTRVSYLDCSAEHVFVRQYVMNSVDWDYKHSPFQKMFAGSVIVSAELRAARLTAAESAVSVEKSVSYIENRREKGHFKFPSAGSAFKNNHAFGKPSGVIIDEAGLRGFCIGGAQVAPWHGNFIINTGTATAHDIKAVVEYVIRTVQLKTGFTLEPEIIFLAEIK